MERSYTAKENNPCERLCCVQNGAGMYGGVAEIWNCDALASSTVGHGCSYNLILPSTTTTPSTARSWHHSAYSAWEGDSDAGSINEDNWLEREV